MTLKYLKEIYDKNKFLVLTYGCLLLIILISFFGKIIDILFGAATNIGITIILMIISAMFFSINSLKITKIKIYSLQAIIWVLISIWTYGRMHSIIRTVGVYISDMAGLEIIIIIPTLIIYTIILGVIIWLKNGD